MNVGLITGSSIQAQQVQFEELLQILLTEGASHDTCCIEVSGSYILNTHAHAPRSTRSGKLKRPLFVDDIVISSQSCTSVLLGRDLV